MAFAIAWLMNVAGAIPEISSITNLTWYSVAQWQANVFGFFAMTMFGAIYYIVPHVMGIEWPCAKLVRAHYWLSAIGIIFIVLFLALGGVVEGVLLRGTLNFSNVTKITLNFLRISTIGELFILGGNLMLLGNLLGIAFRCYKTHFVPVYKDVMVEVKPAEVKP